MPFHIFCYSGQVNSQSESSEEALVIDHYLIFRRQITRYHFSPTSLKKILKNLIPYSLECEEIVTFRNCYKNYLPTEGNLAISTKL